MMYTLLDARQRNREHPDTFLIPSDDEIARALRVGGHVKVVFQAPPHPNERMWVKITKNENGAFEGTLANDPAFIPPDIIKFGDVVKFETKHIIALLDDE